MAERITMEKWRKNKNRVAAAKKIINSGEWALMRECLMQNQPSTELPLNSSASNAGFLLGKAEGYRMALRFIDDMAEPIAKPEDPAKETYQD